MSVSLGHAWQGWTKTSGVTITDESARCSAGLGGTASLTRRVPVRAGESLVFSLLCRRISVVLAETATAWQGPVIVYYPYEGCPEGQVMRAHTTVIRPSLQEYRLPFTVPETAGAEAFVELVVGSFESSAAELEFLRPLLEIKSAVLGSARQVAAGRLKWSAADSSFHLDALSPSAGLVVESYAAGVITLVAEKLATAPLIFVQPEASATSRHVLAKAGQFDRSTGRFVIELVSLLDASLVNVQAISGIELIINVSIEV
ncbi:hypothetical protein [Pseudomonas fluorescens]|uniref:Uncharacterized protein n=1 Tax=Pseudomonas fluorescens TaxID=294 RepID=A0A5E7AL03_PSEFL|nr:hypothetical protein [Pseudomonas fluorescens]VVN76491.1 hypothetical protein PS833_00769 [Pseudomonas fluorescens]